MDTYQYAHDRNIEDHRIRDTLIRRFSGELIGPTARPVIGWRHLLPNGEIITIGKKSATARRALAQYESPEEPTLPFEYIERGNKWTRSNGEATGELRLGWAVDPPPGVDYWLWTSDGTSREPIIYACSTVRITAIRYEREWREAYGAHQGKGNFVGGVRDFIPKEEHQNGAIWWSRLLYIPASVAIRAMDTIAANAPSPLLLKDYYPLGFEPSSQR